MTRRPDWHPSYGTPIPNPPRKVSAREIRNLQRVYDPTGPIPFPKEPTLAERTAAMRDRQGIPHPRRLHGWGIAFGFTLMTAGIPLADNYFPVALAVQALGAAFVVPNVKAIERRNK